MLFQVRLYAVCSKEEPIYIVTELIIHGSLLHYLREGPGRNMKLHPIIDMAAQVPIVFKLVRAVPFKKLRKGDVLPP